MCTLILSKLHDILTCVCILLYRQITLEVCKIIEDLYNQYVAKAASESIENGQLLNQTHIICIHICVGIDTGGVFSVQANLSRLRAELTLQANKR